jgi:hypothetical protein
MRRTYDTMMRRVHESYSDLRAPAPFGRAGIASISANKITVGTLQNPGGTAKINLDATGAAVAVHFGGFEVTAAGDATFDGTLAAGIVTTDTLASLSGGGLTINFAATGTDPVLSHSGFTLKADGSATFSGVVASSSFTAPSCSFGAIDSEGGIRLINVLAPGFGVTINCDDSGAFVTGPADVASLKINSVVTGWGANNSGGSGKRALVTDNI